MILLHSKKIGSDVLTFQKKKLYYNPFTHSDILFPYQLLFEAFCLLKQTMHNYLRQNKCSFFLVFFIFVLVVSINNSLIVPNLSTLIPKIQTPFIQLQIQALNIPQRKTETSTFFQFKLKFNKKYDNSQQEVFRSIIYLKNRDKINKNNEKTERKFNMILNKFADLTPNQFSQTFTSTFKSSDNVKSYSKKLIDAFAKLENYQISDSLPSISNIKSQLANIKNYLTDKLHHQNNYLSAQNEQFSILEKISSNTNFQFKSTKLKDISSYLDSLNQNITNLIQKNTLSSTLTDIKTQLTLIQLYLSLEDQLNNVLKPFTFKYKSGDQTTVQPLKQTLTSDTSLSTNSTNKTSITNKTSTNTTLPTTGGNFSSIPVDWTVHAGKIRYQGVCGACYTFATSDAVGSIYSIYKYGFFVALSTQQVVDCSTNGLTYGCNGGFLQGSYAYMQIKGIQTDYNYPYTSVSSGVSGSCKKDGGSFKISSFKNIQQGNCKALVTQLNYGPVSIGIAGYRLQFYSEGIFNDCNSYIDHAVVLIAYKGGVGWKIKNSWGPDWGMNGFAWIADGNNCGICNMAVAAKL